MNISVNSGAWTREERDRLPRGVVGLRAVVWERAARAVGTRNALQVAWHARHEAALGAAGRGEGAEEDGASLAPRTGAQDAREGTEAHESAVKMQQAEERDERARTGVAPFEDDGLVRQHALVAHLRSVLAAQEQRDEGDEARPASQLTATGEAVSALEEAVARRVGRTIRVACAMAGAGELVSPAHVQAASVWLDNERARRFASV